ncbi:MAG: hypothetical protein PHI58_06975 [Candidatus Omnitrophica bacterium]|nr:hypothetical protein [Candidatus Omnitrophota bacterium]
MKTRSLERIEERMTGVEPDSIRYRVLQSAKNFKTSWIELGQALYTVWKDKAYKEWGYLTFDAYTQKEIGIKKPTAMKLLKSYYFLEKEEPVYLQKEYSEAQSPASVPSYEAVNLLRLAKSKNTLDKDDYQRFKKNVFEEGRDPGLIKKDLTSLMRQREELSPDEARQKRKFAVIKRMVSTLNTLKMDAEAQKLLPAGILKEMSGLIHRLEAEIS